MKITKDIEQTEQKKNNKNFISAVLDEIFLICKEDKNFQTTKNRVDEINQVSESLVFKVKKQDSLLTQSSKIRNDVIKKIEIIDSENFRIRATLLEELGSAI